MLDYRTGEVGGVISCVSHLVLLHKYFPMIRRSLNRYLTILTSLILGVLYVILL